MSEYELPIEKRLLDHGYIALTDVMGDDRTPAKTARTSFKNASKERSEEQDAKLTKYLVNHKHNTPIEFCQVRFYMKMPIFVARQLVRHRTCSINEVSYRYVTAEREFYIPELSRMQGKAETNKQGSSSETVADPAKCSVLMSYSCNLAFDTYETLLEEGLAPEIARAVLPCNTYTEWYWQQNLHNFLHMAGLRTDPHAQWETRQYALAALDMVEQVFPTIVGAWRESR
jgi:thymidylate synthase (FAD)